MMRIALFFILASLLACTSLKKDKADQILAASFKAHGGIYTTDSLKIACKFSIPSRTHEGQSLVSLAPFEKYFYHEEVWIDRPAKKELLRLEGSYAGISETLRRFVVNGEGMEINEKYKRRSKINFMSNPRQFLHHSILETALRDSSKVKFKGLEKIKGREMYHLTVDTVQLFIDTQTDLVARLERNLFEPVYGRGLQIIEWSDYVRAGKIMVPQKHVSTKVNAVYDTIVNEATITNIQSEFTFPEKEFVVPEEYTFNQAQGTKDCELQKLADNLYLLESIEGSGGAYHNLIAEFADYILVAESPVDINVSRKVIAKLRELFPGKPVRYLVQSHHHNDHIGGVWGYVEAGATLVTTPNAGKLVSKMAEARRTNSAPTLDLVNKSKSIKDSRNECIVLDFGPHAHANEILVLYFPKQKLIHQADLEIDSDEFRQAIKSFNLDVEIITSVHDDILKGQSVKDVLGKK